MPKARLNDPTLGPEDGVIIPVHPEFGIVIQGEVIEGPDEVIGVAPFWRQPKEGDDLAFMETRANDLGEIISVHDLGRGLLAQTDRWERAEGGDE